MYRGATLACALWLIALATHADLQQAAGQAAGSTGQALTSSAATDQTLVRFHVVRSNSYVGGLTRDDVQLLDNGVERSFELFEGGCGAPRTLPVEMALLFDTSLVTSSTVAPGLLDWISSKDTLLRATVDARVAVYGYNRYLRRYIGFTDDPEQVRDALRRVLKTTDDKAPGAEDIPLDPPAKKGSADSNRLNESVLATARQFGPSLATRVILVFSYGKRAANVALGDVIGPIQALGVAVFPVVIDHRGLVGQSRQASAAPGAYRRPSIDSAEADIQAFLKFGELTGGRSFDPPQLNLESIRATLGLVNDTVRCGYVIGFASGRPDGAPRRHDLEVKVRAKDTGRVLGGKRTMRY